MIVRSGTENVEEMTNQKGETTKKDIYEDSSKRQPQ